jgi:hypothetical protein
MWWTLAMADTLLTEAEAAARLRVCTKTLRSLRRTGQIRYVAVTQRKILYRPEDCDAFVDARSRTEEPVSYTPPRPRPRTGKRHGATVVSFTARRQQRLGAGG